MARVLHNYPADRLGTISSMTQWWHSVTNDTPIDIHMTKEQYEVFTAELQPQEQITLTGHQMFKGGEVFYG